MSSSATGVGMPICFLGAILLILTQKSSQKFGDVLGIIVLDFIQTIRRTLGKHEQLGIVFALILAGIVSLFLMTVAKKSKKYELPFIPFVFLGRMVWLFCV